MRILFAILVIGVIGASFARYVQTPQGRVWHSCVHKVEVGTHVHEDPDLGVTRLISPDGGVRVLPRCPMPTIRNVRSGAKFASATAPLSGWQVWTTFQHPSNATFETFLGNFTVPKTPASWPASDEAILYMFTGLQSDNWVPIAKEPNPPASFDIIQPVLQYGGDSEGGGGKYWALASWYVTVDAGAVYTPLISPLNPGDVIFGNMTKTGPQSWYIAGVVNGKTAALTATHPRLASQPWAYCTLETYEIADCSWFPPPGASIQFSAMSLTDASGPISPSWESNANTAHCTAAVKVQSPSALAITF